MNVFVICAQGETCKRPVIEYVSDHINYYLKCSGYWKQLKLNAVNLSQGQGSGVGHKLKKYTGLRGNSVQ